MKILELFSGIGGMHMAFSESGLAGEVKAAIEINPTANLVYKHNFPQTKLLNLNIEGLTAETVNKLGVDTILMSPPCQPFTRNGKQCDVKDARSAPFQHILSLLPKINIDNILIENVKGFEKSEMRKMLMKILDDNSYCYQEFILSPSQIGVPNSRHRYYLLAKKAPGKFCFETECRLVESLPGPPAEHTCFEINDILDDELESDKFLLPDKILRRRIKILDVCYSESRRSCCFTKAYGKFIEGTGSVYTDKDEPFVKESIQKLKKMDHDTEEYLDLAQSLKLRFFTPAEISRLMSFPSTFSFPKEISTRQKYMLLGNSINVKIVAELIKLLR